VKTVRDQAGVMNEKEISDGNSDSEAERTDDTECSG
jgi:hypothetical protein